MIKKLTQYGNSQALIIDKPILAIVGIEKNTQLKITTDGKSIIITPVKSLVRQTRKKNASKVNFQQALDESTKKYEKTMGKLAHCRK